MIDKNNLLLKEIIVEGKLSDYEEIVTSVVEDIWKSNFQISAKYNDSQSITNSEIRLILISLIKEPLLILWDIFHEFGHVRLIEKNDTSKPLTCDKEKKAWNEALVEMSKYPILFAHKASFDSYRLICLRTYCMEDEMKSEPTN
jgi:hypothetical protein